MTENLDEIELIWQGGLSISEFFDSTISSKLHVEGVYLIIENASSSEAKPAWYFGQSQDIFARLRDHISGLMFFQYWYFPKDASTRDNWTKSLWGSVVDFSKNLELYEQQVRTQLPERRKALEGIRLFWAPALPNLREGVEAELISWLFDSAPDSIINAQGKREKRTGLSIRNTFDHIEHDEILAPLIKATFNGST